MGRKKLSECSVDWRDLSQRTKEVSAQLSELHACALLNQTSDAQEQIGIFRYADRINKAEMALAGLTYLTVPQGEWTGGEVSLDRAPHIVTSNTWEEIPGVPAAPAVTVLEYIEQVVPERYRQAFLVSESDADWLSIELTCTVGVDCKQVIYQASLLQAVLVDVSPGFLEVLWEMVVKQCRVFYFG